MGEQTDAGNELVKISILSRRSGVPASTIKYYIQEGLLPGPTKKGRNMALYDTSMIPRIQAIKELQRTKYLPLSRIKELLDSEVPIDSALAAADAISRALTATANQDSRTRKQILEAGVPEEQLDWMKNLGLIVPMEGLEEEAYQGDDLALLQTLGAARKAGISPEMLPYTTLATYLDAIRALVRAEILMFRKGILPNVGGDLDQITEVATRLSERLVVLIRRKLLVPTLRELVEAEEENQPS